MATNKAKRSSISISLSTKQLLDSVKHPGQSYDGLIQELIRFRKDQKSDYWPQRREKRKAEVRRKL